MGKRHLTIRILAGATALLLLAGAIAFVALFSSGQRAEAVTFKTTLTSTVGCWGADGTEGTADDSCTPAQKRDPGVTADLKTVFAIPDATPKHSNFFGIDNFSIPVSWWIALDSDLTNGAYVGSITARTTLSLLNQACTVPYNLTISIPLFDCSTDITNTISWGTDGTDLTKDVNPANGLPDGCDKYPAHALLDPDGAGPKPPLQPRARGYGYTNAVNGAPPTQINFLLFDPGQLTLMPAPESGMGDSLGFSNFVVLDNPLAASTPSAITDFCTPLDTTSILLGLTAGEGKAIPQSGATPEFTAMCTGANVGVDNDGDTVVDDGCFVVTDKCGDGIDNDGDTKIDELCGLVRQINPTVPGIYNTGTHLADTYAEGNRDYDGDGVDNGQDGCPCRDAGADGAPDVDTDNDGIPDVCDPTPNGTGGGCVGPNDDCDNDGFQNRQDNCPLHPNPVPNHTDGDRDSIGDACEGTNDAPGNPGIWQCGGTSATVANGPYSNDMTISGICIGEADTDSDGWCDSTETLLGSDPTLPNGGTKTPEFKGIDYKVVAAQTPPGQAPQSCSNLTFYGTHAIVGTAVDDNGVNGANAADPMCSNPPAYDKTRSEDGCGANTCGDLIDNGAACDGSGTDGADAADPDCWTTGLSDKDADGISDASDSCAGTAPGKDANPAQLNTDATGAWAGDGDASGNACDADADNDGADNKSEWGHGTDPKSPHGASPFDLNADWKVSILDVLLYKPKLPPAAYDYRYDFNLDGSVSILDVLLFKPVLGQFAADKQVRRVEIAGPGVAEILPARDPKEYTVTMAVEPNNPEFTATSVEYNPDDTVPAGKAVVSFYCDVERVSGTGNTHANIMCLMVDQPGDVLTSRDRFAPQWAVIGGNHFARSAVMEQYWIPTTQRVKVPGDGLRWIAESDLHFLSDLAETKNTEVSFTRHFKLGCTMPGSYDVRIYNKVKPRPDSPGIADKNLWNNEWLAILHVTCTL